MMEPQNEKSFYKNKLSEVRHTVYGNQSQLDTVVGIRRHIENHYDQQLHLDALSRAQLISKYHLIRLFKKYYGQTPRQYLIDLRIDKAKALLRKGLSVTEACFAVGFESLGSFSSLFKTKTGKPPSAFRKEQLSRSPSK